MMALFNKIYSDKLLNWFVSLTAYFLLVTAILKGRPEPGDSSISIVVTILLALSTLFLIIRFFLVAANRTRAKSEQITIIALINNNRSYVRVIGYVWLIGLILAPQRETMWIIYGIAAFAFIGFMIKLISPTKEKNLLLDEPKK